MSEPFSWVVSFEMGPGLGEHVCQAAVDGIGRTHDGGGDRDGHRVAKGVSTERSLAADAQPRRSAIFASAERQLRLPSGTPLLATRWPSRSPPHRGCDGDLDGGLAYVSSETGGLKADHPPEGPLQGLDIMFGTSVTRLGTNAVVGTWDDAERVHGDER